ncbi:MAG: hypothetical protein JXR68_10765 [Bacteroidales bacterium]|nr:hypothetical protein [Bacteroidales bacterium]
MLIISSLWSCEKISQKNSLPDWLETLTDSLEVNDYYWGSKIYQYKLEKEYYYDLQIPISSCMYCNIYTEQGNLVNWTNKDIEDYLENRKNELIVWKWEKQE